MSKKKIWITIIGIIVLLLLIGLYLIKKLGIVATMIHY